MNVLQKFFFGLLTGVLLWVFQPAAYAQSAEDTFGIGIMLGEPSGITIKKWLSEKTAFDLGAAWSLSGEEAIHIHSDFLIHVPFPDTPKLAFYYGIGGRVILSDTPHTGVRVPIGLNFIFTRVPFDSFVEIVPIVDISPETGVAGNGAIGIRYYF